MGILWPKSGLIERDNNDERAIGALAYFYDAGTSTPKTVYQDAAETTPQTQPVTSDGNGRWPAVFIPFGSYKETRTTSASASIGSTTDNIPNPAPFDDTVVTDPLLLYATGHLSLGIGNETRSGWVRLNGRSIGSASSSATERANADTADLYTHIYNRCADAQAAVSGGRGSSAAADFAANKRLTLPDWRAAGPRGFDDMGNSAASLLGSAPVVSGSTIAPGSILGANTHTLTTAQLPSHTHTGTTVADGSHTHGGTTDNGGIDHTHTGTTNSGGSHSHTVSGGTFGGITSGALGSGAISAPINSAAAIVIDAGGSHTHGFTTNTASAVSHTHTFTTGSGGSHTHTFTSDAAGSGSVHNNVARDALVTFYIKL